MTLVCDLTPRLDRYSNPINNRYVYAVSLRRCTLRFVDGASSVIATHNPFLMLSQLIEIWVMATHASLIAIDRLPTVATILRRSSNALPSRLAPACGLSGLGTGCVRHRITMTVPIPSGRARQPCEVYIYEGAVAHNHRTYGGAQGL